MRVAPSAVRRPAAFLQGVLLLAAAAALPAMVHRVEADDRASFVEAERALASGDLERFERLLQALTDYPLYPYLRFAALRRNLTSATDEDISAFLSAFPKTPLASRLRPVYLARLAAAGRWSDYARDYRADASTELRCLFLRSLLETGRRDEALAQVEPLWLSARSQPAACDPVFEAWRDAGGLTTARVWERLRLAMEAGERGIARYLGGLLGEPERPWHAHWLRVDAEPGLVVGSPPFEAGDPRAVPILAHGVARLARRSPEAALSALRAWRPRLATDARAWDRAHAAVGRALSDAGDPRGLEVWGAVRETRDNLPQQESRLRAAIGQGAWDRVADWVARMPGGEVKRDRWLYWQGRAEAALGREAQSRSTLKAAARERSLWAFIAADRLGLPYRIEPVATPAEPARIRALASSPTLARMRELSLLGRETDMRREWRELTGGLEAPDLMAAAYIADVMRWHDLAIQALARAGYWDDLDLRFPLTHRSLIGERAWQIGVDADWVFAVIRQESLFARTLASEAGAVGLMQLMPGTAREAAQGLGLDPPARRDLLDPSVNITLGSAYLARMRDRFGHVALATAAYNAGPHRVLRWLPEECVEADLWIVSIPFSETRRYLERVLAYRVIYARRLGLAARVSEWLPPVPGAAFFQS